MDIILYNIIIAIACLIFGYLIGSFPTSVVIGKVFFHQDPRNYGSHNAGGTNAGRLWGKKVGLVIVIIDMIKTIAPLWICWAVLTHSGLESWVINEEIVIKDAPLYYYLAALGTAIGHCWPIYVNFKGGKAASNYMGICCGSSWILFCSCIVYFIFLKMKKYVSLASILSAIINTVVAWGILGLAYLLKNNGMNDMNAFGFGLWGWGYTLSLGTLGGWEFPTVITLMGIIVIIRHRSNIERLKSGSETKIKWMK